MKDASYGHHYICSSDRSFPMGAQVVNSQFVEDFFQQRISSHLNSVVFLAAECINVGSTFTISLIMSPCCTVGTVIHLPFPGLFE